METMSKQQIEERIRFVSKRIEAANKDLLQYSEELKHLKELDQ